MDQPALGRTGRRGDCQVQVAPFRVKLEGAASLLVQVPWKPIEVLPPGAIVPL